MPEALSARPFDAAWVLVQRAGLTVPVVSAMPDPVLQNRFPEQAWQLARVQADVIAFQQALGNWAEQPVPDQAALREAIRGLQRLPRGPRWWRRAWAAWRAVSLDHWRATLEETRQAAHARQQQAQALADALAHMQAGLALWVSRVGEWRDGDPATRQSALTHWDTQVVVLAGGLSLVGQRVHARLERETHTARLAAQLLALVETVRLSQGLAQEQAWAAASAQARRLG